MAINEHLVHTASAAAAAGAGNAGEEGLILHLDANDVDSYDGDGDVWYDIKDHEYTPATDVSVHFNTVTYAGNGTTNQITGVGFQPDFIWIKRRNIAANHYIVDTVRGNGTNTYKNLSSESTNAEATTTSSGITNNTIVDGGFTMQGTGARTNANNDTYVAWCFKAGGAAVSNTDGSVTSQVSANNDLGFSIVDFTTSGGSGTVGHGLDVAPEVVLMKRTSTTSDWYWFYNGGNNLLRLNTDAAATSDSTQEITATTFKDWAGSGDFIAYCFASKRGVSKVGSYNGTGTSGNKVVTGFEPAFILLKVASGSTGSWRIYDNVRGRTKALYPDLANAEASNQNRFTFDTDGFTLTDTGSSYNAAGRKYIYYAIAKNTNETSLIDDTDLELHLDPDSYSGSGSTWTADTGSDATITNASYDEELGDFFDLDGDGDYIDTNSSNGYLTQSNELWVKVDTIQRQFIVSNYGSGTIPQGACYFEMTSSGNIEVGVRNSSGSTSSLTSNATLSAGKWYHLCTTSDGSNLKFYIDGELDKTVSATVTTLASNSQNLIIGYDPRNIRLYLDGQIGQFRVYSSALSETQIRKNFNFTKNDYPNGHNGTITGTSWNPSGYFDFSSSSDKILTSNNTFYDNFSVSLWVNFDDVTPASGYVHTVFSKNSFYASSHTAFPFAISNDAANTLTAGLSYGNDYTFDVTATGTISTGTWYHVLVTAEKGDKLKLYLTAENGTFNTTPTSESSYTGTVIDGINANYAIGNVSVSSGSGVGKGFLNGQISKVKMYDRILTSSEASAQFTEGK